MENFPAGADTKYRKGRPMPDTHSKTGKMNSRNQIMALVDRMPEDMQLKLLRYLESKLPKHIKGDLITEKRTDSRRHCLIGVEYQIEGTVYSGFILDINSFGVFIESDAPFAIDQEITLNFTLPRLPQAYHTEATVVWSGTQGFGAKFTALNQRQLEQIKAFTEEKSRIYTIIS